MINTPLNREKGGNDMQKYDVFISYARTSSSSESIQLSELLTDKGFSVFLDHRSIPTDSNFPKDIAESLLNSKLMVIFADPTYFERFWCVCEYQIGLTPYRKARIPTEPDDDTLAHIVIE